MSEENMVREVPSSLKQLARFVVRGFYTIEDALIIDMLVRNPCMKEDDICELLRFEKKMLRARIAQLKNDKFIQVRLRMDTGTDGKAQKVNYYFINYKTFVNVVKYKLDLMRKRLETEERDATSRASFKCIACMKTFTDLEVDQLFDYMAQEFRCTYCGELVEEDASALPKKDSRLLLAKFNEQLEPLYILLREVEGIKLAPEVLEPEPVDINTIKGLDKKFNQGGKEWSGEASRNAGFLTEETRIDITFGDELNRKSTITKETPIWMTESTIIPDTNNTIHQIGRIDPDEESNSATATTAAAAPKNEDILNVLLAHEKHSLSSKSAVKNLTNQDSDSDDQEMMMTRNEFEGIPANDHVGTMESDDEEDDSNIPTVNVGNKPYLITDINDNIISKMTQSEKEIYVHVFQEYYSHMNY